MIDLLKSYNSTMDVSILNSSITPDGWIYIGDDKVQFAIGEPQKQNILIFGVNPSTATPIKLDPTIRRVKNECVDATDTYGWIMVNLYPLRTTKSENLPYETDTMLSEKNLEIISGIVQKYQIERVWAAWGNMIDTRDYLIEELNKINEKMYLILKKDSPEWFHKGKLTKRGNPRHPLYLSKNDDFKWFPVTDYIYSYFDVGIL